MNKLLNGNMSRTAERANTASTTAFNRPASFADDGLENLKVRLLEAHLSGEDGPQMRGWIRQAAAEAVSAVWNTPFPALLLPELLAEKVMAVRVRTARQQDIQARSQFLSLAE